MADKQDQILSHNYDGIQEYDNSLPRWWLYLFYGTILWGVVYVAYYQFGPGLSQTELLALEMKDAASSEATKPTSAAVSEEQLAAMLGDSARVQNGQTVFAQKCAACHGLQGQGIVGPNLTDDNWIHGGTLVEMRKTVVEGVLAKGMLSWRGLLTEDEISNVVVYIRSIRGTNPPNAKGPEGVLVPLS